MNNKIVNILAFVMAVTLFVLFAKAIIDTPVVAFSHSTGECVKVYSYEEYACDNLPEKYERTWVE